MSILGQFLGSVIKQGTIAVHHPDGSTEQFGSPAEGFPDVAVRLADKSVMRQILLDPRLGAAEAFMDGRLILEKGDIMELIQLLRANRKWERGGRLKEPGPIKQIKDRVAGKLDGLNNQRRS
ncbi:MAG: SAM-dependent methyltransferase, partial [Pseudomonadota bacterium]